MQLRYYYSNQKNLEIRLLSGKSILGNCQCFVIPQNHLWKMRDFLDCLISNILYKPIFHLSFVITDRASSSELCDRETRQEVHRTSTLRSCKVVRRFQLLHSHHLCSVAWIRSYGGLAKVCWWSGNYIVFKESSKDNRSRQIAFPWQRIIERKIENSFCDPVKVNPSGDFLSIRISRHFIDALKLLLNAPSLE